MIRKISLTIYEPTDEDIAGVRQLRDRVVADENRTQVLSASESMERSHTSGLDDQVELVVTRYPF